MIKPRRIGHATFETPDLEKAIAYYEKFMGLLVAERPHRHQRHAAR